MPSKARRTEGAHELESFLDTYETELQNASLFHDLEEVAAAIESIEEESEAKLDDALSEIESLKEQLYYAKCKLNELEEN